jgi:hypothetical protein
VRVYDKVSRRGGQKATLEHFMPTIEPHVEHAAAPASHPEAAK